MDHLNSPIGAEQWGCQRGQKVRHGSNSPIDAEQWGGQRGPKGPEGSKWIKFSTRAKQWGVKGVRGPALRGSEKSRK